MIFEVLVGILFALILYLLFRNKFKWLSGSKTIEGNNSKVLISMNTDIDCLSFEDELKEGKAKKKFEFERKNLKNGEKLEFVYPLSKKSIIILAKKDGEEKEFNIELF